MSFSSRPGTSAVTRISFSPSETSTLGQFPPKEENLPSDGRGLSKPRKTSSNSRFTSRCSDRNGSRSPSRYRVGVLVPLSRPHGIKSRTFIIFLLLYLGPSHRWAGRDARPPIQVSRSGGLFFVLCLG